MKKIFMSLGIAAMLGMASCSEDFEVTAPYKETTVVYGIWDLSDTAHYVRIQKSFLDENKSAIDLSKVSDSNYFRDITVVVKELEGTNVRNTYPMVRVDLAKEGFFKDSASNEQGFFTSPHYGYKLKKTIKLDYRYRLVITNNENGNVDSSEIALVEPPGTRSFPSNNFQIAFSRTTGKFSFAIDPTTNAKYYESIMRFNYVDINTITKDSTSRHVDMFLGRVVSNGQNARVETLNYDIYQFLASEIGKAPSNIARKINTIDFLLFAGSNELYQYELLSNTRGGITNDQIKPIFTNIIGKDAVGLFAAKAHDVFDGYPISQNTVDSLMLNDLTKPLNIIKP